MIFLIYIGVGLGAAYFEWISWRYFFAELVSFGFYYFFLLMAAAEGRGNLDDQVLALKEQVHFLSGDLEELQEKLDRKESNEVRSPP